MIKFWKKTAQNVQNSTEFSTPNSSSASSKNNTPYDNSKTHSFDGRKGPLADIDEGLFDIDGYESSRERSKLSKTLQEILNDKGALSYFIQYMESRNASPYIMCFLDIDTFKSDLQLYLDLNRPNFSPVPNSKIDHDSLSVSTDCDSLTADSNSLCEYSSTLSEKSQPVQVLNRICDISDKDKSDSLNKNIQYIIDNALVIFKKYIAQEATCNIKCSEEIRNEIMENICDNNKVMSGTSFDNVQNFVFNIMDTEFFNAFMGTDYFCKYQIDVLTSGNVVLEDILYNETALFYFMEFLEQENHRSLLEFWIAATNFQQQMHNQKNFLDPIEAQNDAVVLYDKYFSLQATCPLGFSNKIRFAVEQNICGENGLILDCFHLPLKIIEQVIENNYLKSFLASQLFYKYLSDLINTVQSNGYSTSIESKYSPSDCSSEKSFSTNTFLAMEIPRNIKRKEKSADMTIDTRELYDPDALWKRKRMHRLSLGHVTQLGKYETEFEPEPDRKEFKLKDVMRKFVSLDEETKKKEEMAWQVAEMIVKDITNVTLNDKM